MSSKSGNPAEEVTAPGMQEHGSAQPARVEMIEKMLLDMYEKHRKEIMGRVHRVNHFGNSETQIDFFEDGRVLLHDHATPCKTYYNFDQPIFGMCMTWDPFLSYEELDDAVKGKIGEFLDYLKMRSEIEKDFLEHPEDYM